MVKNKILRFLLVTGVLLLIPSVCMATITGIIKGKVQNEDGQPLVEAAITFGSNSLISPVIALTDENGEYIRAGLPPGNYTISVAYIGYKDVEKTDIRLGIGDELRINFVMSRKVLSGEDVTIVGDFVDREKTGTTDKITEEDIEDIASGDPGASYQGVIERLPGVLDGHIRGGEDDEIGYKVDGATIIDPVSGTFGTNINSNAIEEIEVSTGGFQAEYGDNMSGVVNIVTKSGGDEYHGTVEMFFMNNNLYGRDERDSEWYPGFYLEGPIKKNKAWFTVSGRLINWDYEYRPEEDAKPYLMDNSAYWRGFDITSKLTWQVNQNDKLVAEFIMSDADFKFGYFTYPDKKHSMQEQTAYISIFRWDHLFSMKSFLETTFSYGQTNLFIHLPDRDGDGDYRDEYSDSYLNAYIVTAELRDGWQVEWLAGTTNFLSDQSRDAYTLNLDYTLRVADKHRLRLGGDVQLTKWTGSREYLADTYYYYLDRYDGDVYDPNDPSHWTVWYNYTTLDPNDPLNDDDGNGVITEDEKQSNMYDIDGFNGSLYFQDHWKVIEVLSVDAGIRLDYEDQTESYDIAPRLGVVWSPNEKSAVRANYGIFYNQAWLWWSHFGEFGLPEYDAYWRGDTTDKAFSTRYSQMNNQDLGSEKTQMWEITYERNLHKNKVFSWLRMPWLVEQTRATLTYWHKEMTDLIEVFEYSKFDDNDLNGTFDNPDVNHDNYIVANTGDGNGDGLELRLRRRLTKNFEFLLAYTWMKVEGRLQSYDLQTREYKTETVPLDWDQRNTVRLTGVYYWPWKIKDLKITFQWKYDSGEPYTPYFFEEDGTIQSGETNSKRYPATHSLDMRFIKQWKFGDRMKLDTFINVMNVYNRANVLSVDPFTDKPIFVQFRTNFYAGFSLHF